MITAYRVLRAPFDDFNRQMALAIADGLQPLGLPRVSYPANDTVTQVVVEGAATAITEYKIVDAQAHFLGELMTSLLAQGYQPLAAPFVIYPDNDVMYQVVYKGVADGGSGGDVEVTVSDITDATTLGKSLLKAADATAGRTAIGAAPTTLASAEVDGLMAKEDKSKLDGIAPSATANATDAQLRDRATHTGTQEMSTIDGLAAALAAKAGASALSALEGRVAALESASP